MRRRCCHRSGAYRSFATLREASRAQRGRGCNVATRQDSQAARSTAYLRLREVGSGLGEFDTSSVFKIGLRSKDNLNDSYALSIADVMVFEWGGRRVAAGER